MIDPSLWTKEYLIEWLGRADAEEEGWYFDFKQMIPTDVDGKTNLKQEFCAFANGRGGYLIFGVDNDRNAVGLEPMEDDFKNRLSSIVTTNIFPATIDWDVCKTIMLDNGKPVKIVKIQRSTYKKKPHVFYNDRDGLVITVRENGNKRELRSGDEIRALFFSDSQLYQPEYDQSVVEIVAGLKMMGEPDLSMYDVRIFRGFKLHYLEKLQESPSDGQLRDLCDALKQLEPSIYDLKRSLQRSYDTEGGQASAVGEDELRRRFEANVDLICNYFRK